MGKDKKPLFHLLTLTICFLCVPSSLAQTCGNYLFTGNRSYTSCSDLPVLSSHLHWNVHTTNNTVDIAFRMTGVTTSNWVAWALNPARREMRGSQALVAFQHSNGSVLAYTSDIANLAPSMTPSRLSFDVSNIRAEYFSRGEFVIYATLQLNSNLLSTNQVWQVGPLNSDVPAIHLMNSANEAAVGTVDFQSGSTSAGGGSNSKDSKKNIHGVLNAVSWGIMMPIGIMMARYVKVFKCGNPAWFYLHVGCQFSAYVIGVAGWATGLKLGSDSPGITYDKHRNIGITLFSLATLQVFALLLRPKPDHKYRLYWNIYHWSIGYTTIILSIINMYEGFEILNPEKKWKNAYTGVIISLGTTAAVWEALSWIIVLKRKKTGSSDDDNNNKHVNGVNGVNGYGRRSEPVHV